MIRPQYAERNEITRFHDFSKYIFSEQRFSILWHRQQAQSCLRARNSITEASKRGRIVLHGLQMLSQLLD